MGREYNGSWAMRALRREKQESCLKMVPVGDPVPTCAQHHPNTRLRNAKKDRFTMRTGRTTELTDAGG